MAFFKKRNFYSHRPERPLKPSWSKGSMGSKTAVLEMKPLTALLAGESQSGIFQKTQFLLAQARKAVKTLMAKRVDWVESGFLEMKPLTALIGGES